jgi:hypothetical protein
LSRFESEIGKGHDDWFPSPFSFALIGGFPRRRLFWAAGPARPSGLLWPFRSLADQSFFKLRAHSVDKRIESHGPMVLPMKLPTQVLVRILGGTNVKFRGGGTQRMAGRAGMSLAASVLAISKNSTKVPRAVTITDISSMGVGMVRAEPMMPRSEFILFLPCEAGTSVGIRCAVQWCRKDFEGRFKIGADFLEITEEQIPDSQSPADADEAPSHSTV